ncbi:MAG TPA: helix-turn-helix domain-containing protein [Solirubrobacteraceae bacterium]|nr:helix-turn-helix domain-containing protein [Solirubrobacteraceae bacterium]
MPEQAHSRRGNRELGVHATLRKLAETLTAETDELVETMFARMINEVPTFAAESRPELASALRASCYGNVRAVLAALGSDRIPPVASPGEAMEEARVTARAGVALEPLLHTYRIGHAVVLERLMDLVDEMQISARERRNALQIGSRYLFTYIDRVVSIVTDEYSAERDRVLRSSIQRRVQLVRDVLSGATVTAAELGYDPEQEHLGLIADGHGAEHAVRELGELLDRRPLTLAMSRETVWAWLGSPKPLETREWRRLTTFSPPFGTVLCLGEPGFGLRGFRETHEQALAAHRVASHLPCPVTRYDDVALEAALLADTRTARAFVKRELGPLTGDDARTEQLRLTLRAYLGTGLNAAAAAAMLGVNDRTVAYRMRGIEHLLGRTVAGRSAELAAALRLHEVFSAPRGLGLAGE